MHSNNDLIGQCLSNDRQIFNEHVFFNGGGERRGTNGWFPALSAGWGLDNHHKQSWDFV